MIWSGISGEVVFMDHVKRNTRGFADSSVVEVLQVRLNKKRGEKQNTFVYNQVE